MLKNTELLYGFLPLAAVPAYLIFQDDRITDQIVLLVLMGGIIVRKAAVPSGSLSDCLQGLAVTTAIFLGAMGTLLPMLDQDEPLSMAALKLASAMGLALGKRDAINFSLTMAILLLARWAADEFTNVDFLDEKQMLCLGIALVAAMKFWLRKDMLTITSPLARAFS